MRRFAAFAVVLLATYPVTTSAETILANDGVGESFNGTSSSAEVIEGEMYEAVFDIPEAWLPVELLGVQVVMVAGDQPGEYCAQYGLEVWDEGTANPDVDSCEYGGIPLANVRSKEPGMNRFSQEIDAIDPMTGTPLGFEIVGDPNRGNATIKEMRFSALQQGGITLFPVMLTTSRVRIGVKALSEQCTSGGIIRTGRFPVLLSDLDGVAAPFHNFIYGEPVAFGEAVCPNSPKHYAWEDFAPVFTLSQPGDWVMRIILDRNDTVDPPDMGMGGEDMGSGGSDMGGSDMGSGGFDMGGGDVGVSIPDMGGLPDGGAIADSGIGADSGAAANNGNGNNQTNNGAGAVLAIESVTPSEGANDRSVDIVVLGEGFVAGAEVLLDAEAIGVTETRSERIRATVPEGLASGTYDVIVTNPDGASAILRDGYTVRDADVLSDENDSAGGATADGCCAVASGAERTSAPGVGIIALILAFSWFARRRRPA